MLRPEPQPDESGAQPVRTSVAKSRRALSKYERVLTPEEAYQSGVQKMIVQDLERTEEENKELRVFREMYYGASKTVAEGWREAQTRDCVGGAVHWVHCIWVRCRRVCFRTLVFPAGGLAAPDRWVAGYAVGDRG